MEKYLQTAMIFRIYFKIVLKYFINIYDIFLDIIYVHRYNVSICNAAISNLLKLY